MKRFGAGLPRAGSAPLGTFGRIADALERIAHAIEVSVGVQTESGGRGAVDDSAISYANTTDTLARLTERERYYRQTGRRIPIDEPLPKSWTAHLTKDPDGF